MKNLLLGAFLLGTITMIGSCNTKKGRGSETENSTSEDSISKGLVVTLEGVFPINDRFELFYGNNQNFDGKKIGHFGVFQKKFSDNIWYMLLQNLKSFEKS